MKTKTNYLLKAVKTAVVITAIILICTYFEKNVWPNNKISIVFWGYFLSLTYISVILFECIVKFEIKNGRIQDNTSVPTAGIFLYSTLIIRVWLFLPILLVISSALSLSTSYDDWLGFWLPLKVISGWPSLIASAQKKSFSL